MAGRILYYQCVNESQSGEDNRKMKRKDDEVEDEVPRVIIDDFSDLSLISPPVKIRRLDVGDQQIREDEDEDVVAAGGELYMDEMEASEEAQVNDERALVLYRPVHHLHSHPHGPHPNPNPGTCNISFTVPSHLIPPLTLRDEIVHNDTEKERLVVVPWAPPNNFNRNERREQEVELCNGKSMEMEVEMEEQQQYEEERAQMIINANAIANEGSLFSDSSCHQQQHEKHCLAPQFPLHSAAPATPVTWSWL